MKIDLERAMEVAKKQKEIGACSENGQALVLIYEAYFQSQEELEKLSDDLFEANKAYDIFTEQMEEEMDYKDSKISNLKETVDNLREELSYLQEN